MEGRSSLPLDMGVGWKGGLHSHWTWGWGGRAVLTPIGHGGGVEGQS